MAHTSPLQRKNSSSSTWTSRDARIAVKALEAIILASNDMIIDGEIRVRLNIAGYEPGDARACWDNTIRKPKFWAICTGPVSRAPEPIRRRGFQGFRYTEELW